MLALHGIHGYILYWHNDMMNFMGLSENWGWSRKLEKITHKKNLHELRLHTTILGQTHIFVG